VIAAVRQRVRNQVDLADRLGWRGVASLYAFRHQARFATPLRSPLSRHPLVARRGTSDIDVFGQVFIDHEYEFLQTLPVGDGWVVDAGANVGYASARFLTMFPNARLVAVEPDPGNFAVLLRNLAPFGDRATAVQGGIWDADSPLCIAPEDFRDGRAWSLTVREANALDYPVFRGFTLESLFDRFGIDRAALLKLDIEGSETKILRDETSSWIGRVDHVAVELHPDSPFGDPTALFHDRFAPDFELSTGGELAIAHRRPRATP